MATSLADVLAWGRQAIGKPYVYGAAGPDAFDCSGLMQWAFGKAGYRLPRTSQEQARVGRSVPLAQIRPGDLVISSWDGQPASHVSLYVGGGQMLVAPRTGQDVKLSTLDATYRAHVQGVRRLPGLTGTGGADVNWSLPGPGHLPPDSGGSVSGITDAARLAASSLGTIATAATSSGRLADQLMKLALPTTLTRVVAGIVGVGLLWMGGRMLLQEVNRDG